MSKEEGNKRVRPRWQGRKTDFAVEKPFRNSIMKPAYMRGSIVDWLERRSKISLTVAGLVLVILIGAIDQVTPAEMIFAIF